MALYYSWHLFFTEGITTFITDLKRAQPTVFFSVPRLYSKFQQNVFEKISRDKLAQLLKLPVIGTLVGKYILRQMGFDHVQFAASGSAALPLDLLTWFRSLGFPLAEGYGTTEIGITHTALNGECRPGYVGKTAPGVETRISETGEVLLRSPMNMVGYYKNPEDTNQVFTPDGFLRTGDLGQLSADGWLKITGRIKEQFKTAKGEYVTPAKIESLISSDPAVEHCLVLGTNLRAPCAIVVLTAAAARQAATEIGRQALENRFKDLLESVNSHVESHERLALIALLNAQWTIETGFITPTLKLRRTPLESAYNAFLPAWIERNERIVWHLT
jgi:long-subunit acyl-CoA synthetase (AMP-forming)